MSDKQQFLQVQLIKIDESNVQQRVDNFLFSRLKGLPKSRIYRMLRKGEVRVNSGRISAQYKLFLGDLVRIPPVRIALKETKIISVDFLSDSIEERILYEDNHILIINKVAGMAVHGGSNLSFGAIEGLRQLRPDAPFLELVHRLDRATSGCLIFAKKRSALRSLHASFREAKVDKRYLALLDGRWLRKKIRVNAPLRKFVKKSGERLVTISKDGKPSETEFRRMQLFDSATLVEVKPKTGRTHQIRVHAADLGHPIAGDERYGNDQREWKKKGLRRLFLHAAQLNFTHPSSGKRMIIEAPLDQELNLLLENL